MNDKISDKNEIIQRLQIEARRCQVTPSRDSFVHATGISQARIYYHWPRWNDAVREAGLKPNEQQGAKSPSVIASHFLEAIRHYGEVPTNQHLKVFARQRKEEGHSFTAHSTFDNIGQSKFEKVDSALRHAKACNEWDDVIPILEDYLLTESVDRPVEEATTLDYGYVYLVAEHSESNCYKIGHTNDVKQRIQNLQTGSAASLQIVHEIKTDDMRGIEAYWHRRFESRRERGEWYRLSSKDVNAFKRWQKII